MLRLLLLLLWANYHMFYTFASPCVRVITAGFPRFNNMLAILKIQDKTYYFDACKREISFVQLWTSTTTTSKPPTPPPLTIAKSVIERRNQLQQSLGCRQHNTSSPDERAIPHDRGNIIRYSYTSFTCTCAAAVAHQKPRDQLTLKFVGLSIS